MDLNYVLHRTTIKSGKRSRVKNQSFKSRHVDVTAKFSTSLNSSINRDEDLENKVRVKEDTHTYTRLILCAKRRNKHQQLREFFQLFLS